MRRRTQRRNHQHQKYDRELHLFLMYGDHPFPRVPFVPNQNGGGVIRVGNRNYNYDESEDGKGINIRSARPQTAGQFILSIDGDTAVLQNVSKALTPSQTENSKDLVRAAVQIAKERGVSWIELTDNSTICKDGNDGSSVSLADYSFLTRGLTWYQTILPFEPCDPAKLEENLEILNSISWNDIITDPTRSRRKTLIQLKKDLPVDITKIDTNAPGSIMTVLSRIPYEVRCGFYQQYLENIQIFAELRSLKGMKWYLPFKEGVIHPNLIPKPLPKEIVTVEREE